MENNAVKLFVIVVTYKGKRWYDRCFTSLRNSTIPVQTIVVDNASNDGTVEYIKENYPEIMLIESKENLGFGKGNNLAMKYAYEHGCDYAFLLNQDAWLDQDNTLEKLVEVAQSHPEYGILSPVHLTVDKKEIEMSVEYGTNRYSAIMLSDMYCGEMKDVYETNYASAVSWLLPRKSIQEVGGFNPMFQQYGEDDEYLNRMRYYGYKVGICFGIDVVHDHQKTVNPFSVSQSHYLHNQSLLAKLLDMNTVDSLPKYKRYCFRKYIKYLVCRNKAVSKLWLDDYMLIRKHYEEICYYRCQMQQKNSIGLNY